ncbi:hypothetical protein [Homoserinibacter sp. YIM 151385]|uniref:hypothetical protein n=1 Tax=Homoserinibacter sp. YIM 151385 TaxID=2985506 RepID=UPI0022F12785|nr:hypothetical protein [Homoserinibacter sp. YIM 151385]WBU38202.1 hypothetical protein OF852_01060 [Homoserinibacter sp. YIM 151385]
MRRSSRWTERLRVVLRRSAALDDGAAALELLAVGFVVLLPLTYLVLSLAAVQSAVFAAEGAARHAARLVASASDHDDARADAVAAVEIALADAGLEPAEGALAIACRPHPSCAGEGSVVEARVAVEVALPLAPPVIGDGLPLRIPVEASAVLPVSRYGDGG